MWHTLRLERHGNHAKLSLDGGQYQEQGSAPGLNDVLNLDISDGGNNKDQGINAGGATVYFGAEVMALKDGDYEVGRGFVGCLDDIKVDEVPLPLHLNGESQVI